MRPVAPLLLSAVLLFIKLNCFASQDVFEDADISRRKHIVLMVLDDVGRADTGVYGSTNIPTPNINSLAKQGIILDNYYTQTVCSPTRTALMTGRYPFRTGMQHFTTQLPLMASGVPFETPMLPELLQDYESHHVGKHHLGYATWRHTPTGRGFKSHFGYFQGQVDYYTHSISSKMIHGHDFWDGKTPLFHLKGNHTLHLYQKRANEIIHDYSKAHSTIEERHRHPLFLYYAHQIAHIPLQPRKDEQERCGKLSRLRRIYCSMMVELDDAVGSFMESLKHHGIWNETIVFVTTDNGGMVAYAKDENGDPVFPASIGSNTPLRGSKMTMFEGGVRSLAFVTGGAIPPEKRGTRFKGLAHAVDISASILSLAGVLPGKKELLKIDGIDLIPSLFHAAPGRRDHVPINIVNQGKSYSAIRIGKYKIIFNDFLNYAAQGWFDQNGELSKPCPEAQKGATLVFDLEDDPSEQKDLAAKLPDIVLKARDIIQSYIIGNDYLEPQMATRFFFEGLPIFHNGAWAPFMSEERWTRLWKLELKRQNRSKTISSSLLSKGVSQAEA